MFLWERLGAASPGPISPYLANFVTKKAAPSKPATLLPRGPAKKSARLKTPVTERGQSLIKVLEEVHSAVEAVIGIKAGDEQPLMEAGLDSLGTNLFSFNCSKIIFQIGLPVLYSFLRKIGLQCFRLLQSFSHH